MTRLFVALLVLGGGSFVGCDQSTSSSTDGALVAANHDINSSQAADSNPSTSSGQATAGQDDLATSTDVDNTEDGVTDSPAVEDSACDPLATIFREGMMLLCKPFEVACFLHLDLASCLWSCGEYPNGDPPLQSKDIPQDPLTITPENLAKDQCEILKE